MTDIKERLAGLHAELDRLERAAMAYARLDKLSRDDEKTRALRKETIAELAAARTALVVAKSEAATEIAALTGQVQKLTAELEYANRERDALAFAARQRDATPDPASTATDRQRDEALAYAERLREELTLARKLIEAQATMLWIIRPGDGTPPLLQDIDAVLAASPATALSDLNSRIVREVLKRAAEAVRNILNPDVGTFVMTGPAGIVQQAVRAIEALAEGQVGNTGER